jgi:hypothetical protein
MGRTPGASTPTRLQPFSSTPQGSGARAAVSVEAMKLIRLQHRKGLEFG